MPEILTLTAAALELGVSAPTITRYIAKGWLVAIHYPAPDGIKPRVRGVTRASLDALAKVAP